MTTARSTAPARPPAEMLLLPRIPLRGRIQDLAYSAGLTQWAVGFISACYVLITQASYFGHSLKGSWDNLDRIWHFGAIPGIGHWLADNYDLGRHLFMRDAPESVLAYALVAMIITWLATKTKARVPLTDRIMVRLGMPSPYQERLGRHPDTSGLQYLFLLPSMLLAAVPGEIAAAVVIFGGVPAPHRLGYHPAWLTPAGKIDAGPVRIPWVPIVIGVAGGKFAGHKPAVKAGADIQRRFLGKRLALAYAADEILAGFRDGTMTQDQARDMLTRMPRTAPPELYPASYRNWYAALLARRAPAGRYTRRTAIAQIALVSVVVVAGGWGVYLRTYGIAHGFWMP